MITDVSEDEGRDAADALSKDGLEVEFLVQDVCEEADWERVIDETLKQHGRLDVLFNNAGVAVAKSVEETTLDDWRFVMGANLEGVFLGTRQGIKAMKNGKGGSIINNSSIEALIGDRRLAAYWLSRALLRCIAQEPVSGSASIPCIPATSGHEWLKASSRVSPIQTPPRRSLSTCTR